MIPSIYSRAMRRKKRKGKDEKEVKRKREWLFPKRKRPYPLLSRERMKRGKRGVLNHKITKSQITNHKCGLPLILKAKSANGQGQNVISECPKITKNPSRRKPRGTKRARGRSAPPELPADSRAAERADCPQLFNAPAAHLVEPAPVVSVRVDAQIHLGKVARVQRKLFQLVGAEHVESSFARILLQRFNHKFGHSLGHTVVVAHVERVNQVAVAHGPV